MTATPSTLTLPLTTALLATLSPTKDVTTVSASPSTMTRPVLAPMSPSRTQVANRLQAAASSMTRLRHRTERVGIRSAHLVVAAHMTAEPMTALPVGDALTRRLALVATTVPEDVEDMRYMQSLAHGDVLSMVHGA